MVPPHQKINVLLIRAFTGPRHAQCEAIWQKFAEEHRDHVNLRIRNNPGARLSHGECLQEMWEEELKRDEDRCVITEFDFLPAPGLATWPWDRLSLREPIEAAEYVTRDSSTHRLLPHGLPGAWFIRISKPLVARPSGLCFLSGGPFNDPAGLLGVSLRGQRVRLLPQVDRYPLSHGAETPGAGVHLFFSRHFNDTDGRALDSIGFDWTEVMKGVDRELEPE